jgi:DNA polymerase-3 subunit alpha (Gram-positive type)
MKYSFIVVDIETTGISPTMNTITEIGALKVVDDKIVGTYSQLVNPQAIVTEQITQITGLTNEILKNEPILSDIFGEFIDFCEDLPILGHNIMFDFSFLKYHGNKLGYEFERKGLDTYKLATYYVPDLRSKSLTSLIEYFGINREHAHRAFHDAKATYELFRFFKDDYMHEGEEHLFIPTVLHWKAKKTSPITLRQKSFLNSLIKQHEMFTDIEVDKLSKSEASRYIDKILFVKGQQ